MFSYPVVLLQFALVRARALRADESRDRGASAIEWAIIAAITVVAAVLIGGIVYNIVKSNTDKLNQCAAVPAGGAAGSNC
jgi:Flp pilus assembly pilin Flp